MPAFEQTIRILGSFPEMQKKIYQDGRVSFVYSASRRRGKVIVRELYPPTGNGYLCGRYMSDYKVDDRGWISIKDLSADELREMVIRAMKSMSS